MEIPLNGRNSQFSLQDLLEALKSTEEGERPVENWNPSLMGRGGMRARALRAKSLLSFSLQFCVKMKTALLI